MNKNRFFFCFCTGNRSEPRSVQCRRGWRRQNGFRGRRDQVKRHDVAGGLLHNVAQQLRQLAQRFFHARLRKQTGVVLPNRCETSRTTVQTCSSRRIGSPTGVQSSTISVRSCGEQRWLSGTNDTSEVDVARSCERSTNSTVNSGVWSTLLDAAGCFWSLASESNKAANGISEERKKTSTKQGARSLAIDLG